MPLLSSLIQSDVLITRFWLLCGVCCFFGRRTPHYILYEMTRNVKLLRNTSFGLVAFIVLLLAAATFVETVYGSRFVAKHVYGSAFFVLLWGLVALSSVAYLIMRKIVKRLMAFLLHMSFVVILIGAFITHVWGEQGTLHLRHGNVPSKSFYTADGDECELPFEISLKNENAYVTYYKRESLFKILKQIKKIDLEYYTMYLPTGEEIEIYYPYIENLKVGDKLHTSLFNGLDLTNGEYNPNLMLICNNFKLCNSRRVYNFDEKLYKELELS